MSATIPDKHPTCHIAGMPKGPKGEKRPADLNKRAFAILQIATGEVADPDKAPRGHAGGKKGGLGRASKLSPEERSRIAQEGAAVRWKKKPTNQ
jgi:hypothetical protein